MRFTKSFLKVLTGLILTAAVVFPIYGRALSPASNHVSSPASNPVSGKLKTSLKQKGTHRVMTCNIRVTGLEADAGKPGRPWEERKEVCRTVIAKQRPDIICMQEVVYESYAYMKAELKNYYAYGFSGPEMDPYKEGYHFISKNVIFFKKSRYELVSSGNYWFSETPLKAGSLSWGSKRARHCNWVRLLDKKTGEEFRVLNIHLDHYSEEARLSQAKLLIEEAGQYNEDFPQIICGDFNSEIGSPAVDAVHQAGWKDAYQWLGLPERASYHAFKGEEYKKKKRIDFIFLKGKAKPVFCRMIDENINGIFPSDHYFIMADINILK